jgi:hypothetical protein
MTIARVTPSSNARTRSRSASVITRSSVSGHSMLKRNAATPHRLRSVRRAIVPNHSLGYRRDQPW